MACLRRLGALSFVVLLTTSVVLAPWAAHAYVISPVEGESIPFNAQPITVTGGDLIDGSPVEVRVDGDPANLCPGTVAVGPDWSCTLPTTRHLSPGAHTLRVYEEFSTPPDIEVNVTVGPSALAVTDARFTSPTRLEITGTRDSTGSSGIPYGVEATVLLPETGGTRDTASCSSIGTAGFRCTYQFAVTHPIGTSTDVAISEVWSGLTVNTLGPVPLGFPGQPPVVDPPVPPPPVVDPPVVDPPVFDPPVVPPVVDPPAQAPTPATTYTPSPPPGAILLVSPPSTTTTPSLGTTPVPQSPQASPTAQTDSVAAPTSVPGPGSALRLLLLGAIAFAILTMIGPRGLAFSSDQVRRQLTPGTRTDGVDLLAGGPAQDIDETDPAAVLAPVAGNRSDKERGDGATHAWRHGLKWGDRSWTWQLAGWKLVDRASRHAPTNLAKRLPLVARVGADANYLRAVLGAAWLLLPLLGIGLGVWAADQSGYLPVPPSTSITAGLLVFALLDSTSGAAAVLGFAVAVLTRGGLQAEGLTTFDGIRGLLGLAALWFVIPLVAAAARPFRRLAEPEHVYRWDRLGDAVIAAVIGGMAVFALAGGFGDLVGRSSGISHHAGALGLLTAAVILGRVAVEEIVMVGYPARLRAVQHPEPLQDAALPHELRGIVVRALLVALFASAVLGDCWQLWAGVALYVIPQLLSLVEAHLPNLPDLHRSLPRGVVAFFLSLVVGIALAHVISDAYDDDRTGALRDGFVLLAIPSFVLGLLAVFGRTSPPPPWTWPRQLAGAIIVAATIVVAFTVF